MKYRAFIRALGVPDGSAAHRLFEAALESGVKTTAEAKRIFVETRRADMGAQLRAAQEAGQLKKQLSTPEGAALGRYKLPHPVEDVHEP